MPTKVGQALLEANDPRLAQHYTPSLQKLASGEPLSLLEAQGVATTCIKACDDPAALNIDPTCNTVGGHLHIATITLEEGFRWIVPPG